MKNYTFFPVSRGKLFPLKGLTLPKLIKNQAERFGEKTLFKIQGHFNSTKDCVRENSQTGFARELLFIIVKWRKDGRRGTGT